MSKKRPNPLTPEELTGIKVSSPKKQAAGFPAVSHSLRHVFGQSGIVRGTKALLKLNQKNGFDCPSCAWPDPDDERAFTEFCENGAKAVAAETTRSKVDPEFFAKHTIGELSGKSDYWLEGQGRLTHPMYLKKGAANYEPIEWEDAFALIAKNLKSLDSPDQAIFYTSGRASNEAAFLYQLFVRLYGTNNLPDCSNMCHESSGSALGPTIGIGKGTVTLEDFYESDAIFVLGQNPGTNHPRMLSALQTCKRNGGKIVSVNPLKEAGLLGFAHPQEISGLMGKATELTDQFVQVRINGDQAYLKGLGKVILENPDRIDRRFIEEHTEGFEEYRKATESLEWDAITSLCGITEEEIRKSAEILIAGKSAIFCWAMGLTQHENAVATIQEIVNLQLMLGNLGKTGAGLCPVRGHSNVQGDRTMGIYEKMPDSFLDRLAEEYEFEPPREDGFDTVDAIKAMHAEKGKTFIALGGNFISASPDTNYTAKALQNCSLTVQISTKLNRSHLITGEEALVLPCLGRSEKDQPKGEAQFITMENSMGIVHPSQGSLTPASDKLRGEPAIVAGMAQATLGKKGKVPWKEMEKEYGIIRDHIEKIIPGFENFNQRVAGGEEFYLPNNARELDFSEIGGKAKFTVHGLSAKEAGEKRLLLMTIRSHDQYNTTIYGLDDRYRGVKNERRVVFLNEEDMRELGIEKEQPVDLTSHFRGEKRVAPLFLALPYDIPRGSAAAYFPETNVLVPIDSTAEISQTPTSKAIEITISPAQPAS
jgi:molybdopterin-dependent oxidoreductase alpha subunit